MQKVNVICLSDFTHNDIEYKKGIISIDMGLAKTLAMDGRVQLYTGTMGIFNNNSQARAKSKPKVEPLVIDIKPVTMTGSFYR